MASLISVFQSTSRISTGRNSTFANNLFSSFVSIHVPHFYGTKSSGLEVKLSIVGFNPRPAFLRDEMNLRDLMFTDKEFQSTSRISTGRNNTVMALEREIECFNPRPAFLRDEIIRFCKPLAFCKVSIHVPHFYGTKSRAC